MCVVLILVLSLCWWSVDPRPHWVLAPLFFAALPNQPETAPHLDGESDPDPRCGFLRLWHQWATSIRTVSVDNMQLPNNTAAFISTGKQCYCFVNRFTCNWSMQKVHFLIKFCSVCCCSDGGSGGGEPYSSLPAEAQFANSLGLLIVTFGLVVFGLLSNEKWQRPEVDGELIPVSMDVEKVFVMLM